MPDERSRGGSEALCARLRREGPLLLDGATGTELERRGASTSLPLWSAHALIEDPDLVRRIHADYAAAGAEALTANTFRTQRRALARGGAGERAAELTRLAVELAREGGSRGAPGRAVWVLGSAPTLEDCYRPDLVPDDASLAREHAEHAGHLAAAGADAILLETLGTLREARIASRAARATGLPVLASFVCWDGAHLISGEPLDAGVDAVLPAEPIAVLVNCLPPSNVPACLAALRSHRALRGVPFGAYANLGAPDDDTGFRRSEDCTPEEFADFADAWVASGARLVGGCCGTSPDHIRAVAQRARNWLAGRGATP